jgi:hypothetical protein
VFFHPPSGEERTKRVDPKTGKVFCPGGTRLQRMGMREGVPDLVMLHSGRIMGLEVKSLGGTLSHDQKSLPSQVGTGGRDLCRVSAVEEGKRVVDPASRLSPPSRATSTCIKCLVATFALGCARKKRIISRLASGPRTSVQESLALPPDQAWPAP